MAKAGGLTDKAADHGEGVLQTMAQFDVELLEMQFSQSAVLQQRFVSRTLVEQTFYLAVEQMHDRDDHAGEEGKKPE